jgi:hypothetical protein
VITVLVVDDRVLEIQFYGGWILGNRTDLKLTVGSLGSRGEVS